MADDKPTQLTPRDAAFEHRQHTTVLRVHYIDMHGNEHLMRTTSTDSPERILENRVKTRAYFEQFIKSIGGQLVTITMDVESARASELVAPPLSVALPKPKHLQSVPTAIEGDDHTGPKLYHLSMVPMQPLTERVRIIGRAKVPTLADLPTLSFQSQMQH